MITLIYMVCIFRYLYLVSFIQIAVNTLFGANFDILRNEINRVVHDFREVLN